MKRLLQPPRLRSTETSEKERHATWMELFYDLVFVVAVAELSHSLSHNISPAGIGAFAALFVPVWWCWIGTTFYADRFDTDDVGDRLLVALQMLAVAALAINVHFVLEKGSSRGFALSYAAMRAILVFMYFRAGLHISIARPLAYRYALGFSIAIGCWIASTFVSPPLRFGLWAAGLVIDFITPLTVRTHQAKLQLDIVHLPERFGLFTIIVLGESVVATVSGVSTKAHWDISSSLTATFGLFLAFSLWWIYFDSVEASAIRRTRYAGQVWVYTHLPLVMSLTAAGASMKLIVSHEAGHPLPDIERWLFAGVIALSFVSIGVINLTTVSKVLGSYGVVMVSFRFAAAAIVLCLAAIGSSLPPAVFVGLVMALGAAQVIIALVYKARNQTESEVANS